MFNRIIFLYKPTQEWQSCKHWLGVDEKNVTNEINIWLKVVGKKIDGLKKYILL